MGPTLQYLEFDGNDDYVTGSADFNFGAGDFTFTAWAAANDVVNRDRKLFHYNESGTNAVWQVRQGNKKLSFNTWNGGWTGVATVNDVFDDTDWHHIAMVRVGTAVTIYVDGVLQATRGSIHANLSTSETNDFFIGARPIEDIQYWYGAIDEVRIWDHARTEAEILLDMNLELTGFEPGLGASFSS